MCVAHVLQDLTQINPLTTVTSVDGVSAFDLISRSAMLEAAEGGRRKFSFAFRAHVLRDTL